MINIDSILKEKGLSKTDIAKRMDLSRESLYRILSGNPTLDNLNKLANALEIPLSELFEQPLNDIINCPHCGGKIKISKA
jgi:transcriptional regulator with XRE-family HTH domain